ILFEDLAGLTEARRAEDERLVRFADNLTDAQLEAAIEYRTFNGSAQQQKLREVLAHLFNHQTHHRGQAHAILTALGVKEPESLDVLWMLRERPAR
ncbi:MAG TPA: DinB family protein, partial [Polyangiaceae bacterium]